MNGRTILFGNGTAEYKYNSCVGDIGNWGAELSWHGMP